MKKQELSTEAQIIYDLVCRVGTVVTPQVEKILKNTNSDPENIVKFLCLKRYTKWLNETYSIPFYRSTINLGAVGCLWVALELLSDEEDNIDIDALDMIMEGNGIVDFSYIQDSNKVVNMIYIGESDLSKIIASKQRFYDYTGAKKGEEKQAGIVYVYVTSSKEMVSKIKDAAIDFPHMIAYLENDILTGPTISFF